MTLRTNIAVALSAALGLSGCSDDETDTSGPPEEDTTEVGTFEGLFDDVTTGFNYPYDVAIAHVGGESGEVGAGDILVANYGTSEVLIARDPSGGNGGSAEAFYDGAEAGLSGAMAVSMPPDGNVWSAFERGGDGDNGGVVVLSPAGDRLALIDGSVNAAGFANPGGLCFGRTLGPSTDVSFFLVNKGDGTLWRIEASVSGDGAALTQVGSGLATGSPGEPGSPPDGVTNKKDLPENGARGCAYHDGNVYVADAQNARVVRFDGVDDGTDLEGALLDDVPAELVTYPTGVTINSEGALIVISFDNAKAFVSLETPSGAFIDNGLHDLNVNSGNYGVQVGDGTIWFTRANNTNGALRAITQDMETPPTTNGDFPAQ